jgi:hypothetical protein
MLQATYFGVSIAQNEQQALLWYIINIPFSSAQIFIYYYFIRAFLGFKQPKKLIINSVFIWLLIVCTSIVFHSGVITDIYRDSATG